ncbi:hypothetical protein J8281_02360 [Aquimarina sp. U1-2]|uniref:hypothetical protein n=1 Tax=Aquimarina sp. U1-2 TaxID=2823141 RepID=UPI001AECD9D2|nr:hypothetical protein [Aquimarina sp. U1-2]MBP2831018.1 hypothetical protein [Aquimarina sp. U1-2]
MKNFKKSILSSILFTIVLFSTVSTQVKAQTLRHIDETGKPFAQIETSEQGIIYNNLLNLAARWNNIVIFAETGSEQLKMMRESGVFADNFTITFNLPNGTKKSLTGLDNEAARAFYDQVVNEVGKSNRMNLSSNIEVLQFTKNGAKARFKYLVLIDGKNAWGGENVITIGKQKGRFVVETSEIFLLITDTPGLKE